MNVSESNQVASVSRCRVVRMPLGSETIALLRFCYVTNRANVSGSVGLGGEANSIL